MRADIRLIDAATVMDWMKEDGAVLVDVREAYEYQAAHIPGATLLPLSAFDPAKVPAPSGRKLVFHCQSGRRCEAASEMMALAGFRGAIFRLAGGFASWVAAGGPTENGG